MKILFIGNSYTYYNDMPTLFKALALENGKDASVFSVTKGGRRLYENLAPCDENHEKIVEICKEKDLDVLFLQEQSLLPLTDTSHFHEGITALASVVGAKRNILYATWGRNEGSPTLSELGLTSATMTDALFEKYSEAGRLIGAEISPVGLLFKYITEHFPDIQLYNPDRSHPSYFGSAVAAVCHFAVAFGSLPKSLSSLSLSDGEIKAIKSAMNQILYFKGTL